MSQLPNNYVHLHGYVKKLFLNEKVGTIRLSVENVFKEKVYETFLNVLCFSNTLDDVRQLDENQFVTIHGRLSRKEKDGVWREEVVAVTVIPSEEFHEAKKETEKAFKSSFDVPF